MRGNGPRFRKWGRAEPEQGAVQGREWQVRLPEGSEIHFLGIKTKKWSGGQVGRGTLG